MNNKSILIEKKTWVATDNNGGDVFLSQTQEVFQKLVNGNDIIVLSSEDIFEIGDNTEFGYDYTGKNLYIFTEELNLNNKLKFQNGIISAYQLNTVNLNTIIDLSGINGTDGNVGGANMNPNTPGVHGGNGKDGGNIYFYTENFDSSFIESTDLSNSYIKINVRGGNGGPGQCGIDTTNGGDGGNGGNGGNINTVIINPYRRLLAQLETIYANNNLEAQKNDIQSFLNITSKLTTLSYVNKILTDIFDNSDTVVDLYNAIESLGSVARNWEFNYQEQLFKIAGGDYGIYGTGNTNGKDGTSGNIGIASLIGISSTSNLLTMPEWSPFMFAHPSQCAMTLEKAKLMYYSADLTESETISDIIILLKRLKDRTSVFNNLSHDSDLFKCYQEKESTIGSGNSINLLQNIYTSSDNLLTQISNGMDFFGNDSSQVPLASYTYYKNLLDDLITKFSIIEQTYNTYYTNLAINKATIADIKAARDNQEQILSNTKLNITQLTTLIKQTASTIDGYQKLLPLKKDVLEQGIKDFSDKLQGYIKFDPTKLMAAFSNVAMCPESKLMWVAQASSFCLDGVINITNDQGFNVNRDYLVSQIKAVKKGLDSLVEGYSQIQDGTIDIDDPGAAKLIMEEDAFNQTVKDFYNDFPDDLDHIRDLFKDYIDTVTVRNNQILAYNAILLLLQQNYQLLDQTNQKISFYNDEALSTMNPNLPELTAFMSQIYYSSRSIAMKTLYNAARAFKFWALSDDDILAEAYNHKTLPEINTAVLEQAQITILDCYDTAVENIGNNPNHFKGIKLTINDDGIINSLKQFGFAFVNIPVVVKETQKTPQIPFAGMANVRLDTVRVWVKGATTDDNILQVNITHTGMENITSTLNNSYLFSHNPRNTTFKYNLNQEDGITSIVEDGSIGGTENADGTYGTSDTYALIGPFTTWQITINSDWNENLNLENVTEITMEFDGINDSW
jgi:hypothetical protein